MCRQPPTISIIVEQDVTNQANDKAQLSNISKGAKAVLDVDACSVVADGGYYEGETIKACVEDSMECMSPYPTHPTAKAEAYIVKTTSSMILTSIIIYVLPGRCSPMRMTQRIRKKHLVNPSSKTLHDIGVKNVSRAVLLHDEQEWTHSHPAGR